MIIVVVWKMSPSSNRRGLLYRCAASTSPKQWAGDRWRASTTPGLFQSSLPCGFVWKCCVPLNPMVLLIIIPIKWLFHWEYTLFSDIPMCWSPWNPLSEAMVTSPGGLPAAWQTSFPSRWSIHWPWRIQAWCSARFSVRCRGWKEIKKGKTPASPATQCYTYNRL